jgi:hypothetical protein
MANEISYNLSLTCNSAGQSVSGSGSGTHDAGANGFIGEEAVVSSSTAAALNLGPVTSNPVCVFIKNLDVTNFITVDAVIGLTNFPQKLLAGQAIFLLPETATIYAKADTADCKIWVVAS